MKKMIMLIAGLMLGTCLGLGGLAVAGQVYGRETVALGAATGAGSWTMNYQYSAVKLVRIWDEANLVASNTVTVLRVLSGTTTTQAVASVAFSSGNAGSSATFTGQYLKYGDKLVFSSLIATGSTVIVEFEVQQH